MLTLLLKASERMNYTTSQTKSGRFLSLPPSTLLKSPTKHAGINSVRSFDFTGKRCTQRRNVTNGVWKTTPFPMSRQNTLHLSQGKRRPLCAPLAHIGPLTRAEPARRWALGGHWCHALRAGQPAIQEAPETPPYTVQIGTKISGSPPAPTAHLLCHCHWRSGPRRKTSRTGG